eukprot:CAMPEP_0184327210 /NCGR_PEP_ID=MMETSP1049-20130417/142974_1 /TAXON_ID=77928 /ORGANISM="Proteomonas sulcata, Strain CCMP704" /LENGTH=160 /DNA_ID=CAMNT_0026649455 /DNA_START=273 /DNA_END=755 /DNA_ORIENTATION=+
MLRFGELFHEFSVDPPTGVRMQPLVPSWTVAPWRAKFAEVGIHEPRNAMGCGYPEGMVVSARLKDLGCNLLRPDIIERNLASLRYPPCDPGGWEFRFFPIHSTMLEILAWLFEGQVVQLLKDEAFSSVSQVQLIEANRHHFVKDIDMPQAVEDDFDLERG